MRVLALRIAYTLTRVYKLLRLPEIPGVLVVLSYQDMVVLVRHSYGSDDWFLPGGLRWWLGSPYAQAQKEIVQELGITAPKLTSLGQTCVGNRHLDLFHGELLDYKTNRGAEIVEVGFFKKSQLPFLSGGAHTALCRYGWDIPVPQI